METEEKPTINIDGKNYIIEDLSDAAKYSIKQIQDLQGQIGQTKARLDQLDMSTKGFMAVLKDELAKGEGAE